jgi:glycosyltransferase involved in cell wall biosynthesis
MRFHRLPMIVSAVEGLDEMFEDGFDALKIPVHYDESNFISFAIEEICNRLISVLEDEVLAERLSQNAYVRALQTFTAERMVAEYDAVFQGFFSGEKILSQDSYAGTYSSENT